MNQCLKNKGLKFIQQEIILLDFMFMRIFALEIQKQQKQEHRIILVKEQAIV